MNNKKHLFIKDKMRVAPFIFLIVLAVSIVYLYSKPTQKQLIYQTKQKVTTEPIAVDHIYSTTKFISYVIDKSIYTRNIKNGVLDEEKKVADLKYNIEKYIFSKNGAYLITTGFTGKKPDGEEEIKSLGNVVDINNTKTGQAKQIVLESENKVISEISEVNNNLYISTKDGLLYRYDLSKELLSLINKGVVSMNKEPDSPECSDGFRIINESPDDKKILMRRHCTEGSIDYLLNIDSKEQRNFGFAYTKGVSTIKFLNNDEIYATNSLGDGYSKKYIKLNQYGKTVQELPTPTEESDMKISTIYKDKEDNYFACTIYGSCDQNNRQIIGKNISNLYRN